MSVTEILRRPVALLIVLLLALAVACGASATATPAATESSAAPTAAPVASHEDPATAVPTAMVEPTEAPPTTGGEAKVDRLIMGLISPTRDYFRSWRSGQRRPGHQA